MFARSTTVKFRFFQFARSYVTLDLRTIKDKACAYERAHETASVRSRF